MMLNNWACLKHFRQRNFVNFQRKNPYKHLSKIFLEAHAQLTRALNLFLLFLDDYRATGCSSSDTHNKLLCSEVLQSMYSTADRISICYAVPLHKASCSAHCSLFHSLFCYFFTWKKFKLHGALLTLCLEKIGIFPFKYGPRFQVTTSCNYYCLRKGNTKTRCYYL